MNATHRYPLVSDYLARLDAAAAALPSARRTELVGDVRQHIDDALAAHPDPDELTVRTVVDRLGDPAEVVDETYAGLGSHGGGATGSRNSRILATAALLTLAIGSLLVPIAGLIAGMALVTLSSVWTRRDKLIGLVFVPLGLAAATLAVVLVTDLGMGMGMGEAPLILLFVLGLFIAAYLAWRLRAYGHAAGVQ